MIKTDEKNKIELFSAPITSDPSYTTSSEEGVLPIKFTIIPKKKDSEEIFDGLDEHIYGPGFIPIHRRTSSQTIGQSQTQPYGVLQYLRAARGRIGRGGRLIFDLIVDKPQDNNNSSPNCIPE